jgi:DNA-binding response OmpR family regulator
VLVVDDDPDILEYLGVLLEDHAYEVEKAESSTAAMQLLERRSVDALILDVLLQGKSGLDLLVSLRKDARWSGIPVVFLTGNDLVLEDRGRSYLSPHHGVRGADAVLGKPVEPATLLATLAGLLAT